MAENSENEALLREIPASEILDKIQKGGPVNYDHVRITGELDLSKLDLPIEDVARTEYQINALGLPEESRVVSSSIKITNSKFDGKVNFGNSLFGGRVHFSNSTFSKYADFNGSTFTEYANFKGATFTGHADFSGATFSVYADFSGTTNFSGAIFREYADFRMAVFSGGADFTKVTFSEYAGFSGVTFSGYADFRMAIFSGGADFSWATFREYAYFIKATFSGDAYFVKSTFSGDACFVEATFIGDAGFNRATFSESADFGEATFNEKANFVGSQFKGDDLTFEGAIFKDPKSQEDACRRAKNVLEKNGNREEAGYHFYREMDAKRKQKPWYIRYPEYVFVQLIFGYGVHPFRLMFCWFLVAVIFAIFYSVNGGIIGKLPASSLPQPWSYFVECFYFSVVTAVTPGYGKYELTSVVYQVIASAEAIFGTFMWAAFIATFARKYMR
jgi:uncharacterized protein YjbI with pentapeptide repeats